MNFQNGLKISLLIGTVFFTPLAFSQTDNGNNTTSNNTNIVAKTPEDDAAISRTLKSLINKSKNLSKLSIKFTVEKGVVKYTGTADSDTQVTTLIEYGESIIGVKDVDTSDLKIKDGSQPFADAIITAKIKGLLIREDLFGEKDIASVTTSVETKDGVVYLSGQIENKDQINNAIEIIKKNIPEVKSVEYNVKVFTPDSQQ